MREAAFSRSQKFEQMRCRAGREFGPECLEHILPRKASAVHDPICGFQIIDLVGSMSAASQSHDIETDNATALPIHKHVGRHILYDTGMSAYHREPANPTELMDRYGARNKRSIFNGHVSTKHRPIGADAVVADDHIVA